MFWGWGLRDGFSMAQNYPKYGSLAKAVESMARVRETVKVEELPLQFP